MTTSFAGAAFRQLSDGQGRYAVWAKTGGFIIKKIPGGDKNVIQKFAPAFPRMTMPITGTAAQMVALQGKVGDSGSLIFHFETATARLLLMSEPVSIGIGNDLYFSSLTFIRSSTYFTIPSTAWLTQTGETWLTQSGEPWIGQ